MPEHAEDAVYFDLVWAFALTKIDGYIISDDYLWTDSCKRGIDKFLEEFAHGLDVIGMGYQVVIRKKKDIYNHITEEYYK